MSAAATGLRSLERRLAVVERSQERAVPRWLFWTVVGFMVLEYVRPPLLPQLKIQMFIIFAIPALWFREKRRDWTPVLTVQSIFLAWCAKAIPISSNWFAAYFVTRMMWGNVSIALALTWLGRSIRDFRRIIWIWVAVMSYQAVYALTHGGRGSGGFLGDENDLALACGTAFPFAFLGFDRTSGGRRWLALGAAILLASGVVVSLSRGGFLGLVAGLLYCLVVSKHRIMNIGVLAAALAISPLLIPAEYVDEIRSIRQVHEGTAEGRFFMWTAAYNMWKSNPVLGVGGGNTSFLLGRFQPRDWEGAQYNEMDWSGYTVHSLYFQLLPEHGIPGVLLFIALLVLHRRYSRRVRALETRAPPSLQRDLDLYRSALNGGLIAYLVAGAFLSVLYYPYFWYFTGLMGALELGAKDYLSRLRAVNRRVAQLRAVEAQAGKEGTVS